MRKGLGGERPGNEATCALQHTIRLTEKYLLIKHDKSVRYDLVLVAVVDDRLSEVDSREVLSAENKDSQAPSWTVGKQKIIV